MDLDLWLKNYSLPSALLLSIATCKVHGFCNHVTLGLTLLLSIYQKGNFQYVILILFLKLWYIDKMLFAENFITANNPITAWHMTTFPLFTQFSKYPLNILNTTHIQAIYVWKIIFIFSYIQYLCNTTQSFLDIYALQAISWNYLFCSILPAKMFCAKPFNKLNTDIYTNWHQYYPRLHL